MTKAITVFAAALSMTLAMAQPALATIIVGGVSTSASLTNIRDAGVRAFDAENDFHLNGGSFVSRTYPVFTPPNGAPFDTFGRPAVVAAAQPAFGFNSVAARGFFSNGATNTLIAETIFSEGATGQLGDRAGMTYDLFGGQLGITCYGNRPAAIVDIVSACKPSVGTTVEISTQIDLTRISGVPGASVVNQFSAGLRMEVVADAAAPFGRRVDITQLGSTPLVYNLGFSTVDGFPPYVTLDIDPMQGSLDAGMVDEAVQSLGLFYRMEARVFIPGAESGGLARIADPFALDADPLGYFRTFFPDAELPGFRLGDTGPAPVPIPVAGAGLLWLAGVSGLAALRRGSSRASRRSRQS